MNSYRKSPPGPQDDEKNHRPSIGAVWLFQALSAIKHLVPKNVPVVAVSKAKGKDASKAFIGL